MVRNLVQCIIQSYTGPRTFDALQVPDGYVIKNVRLPNSIFSQTKPLEKSIIFVAQTDDYQAYFVSMVRDPIGFLEKSVVGVQGSVDNKDSGQDSEHFQPGEIYFESVGESSAVSGSGGALYLKNDGTVTLRSGKFKESIVIGQVNDSGGDDLTITGDNGFFESNINFITRARSTIRFDEDQTLEIGNFRVLLGTGPLSEIPINNLTFEPDGEVTLGNYNLLGFNLNQLNMTPLGNTSLTTFSPLGTKLNELDMTPLGNTSLATFSVLGVELNKLEMLPIGTTTLDANIINLNSGIRGVARLQDFIKITAVTDPTWVTFLTQLDAYLSAVFIAFNAHKHTGVQTGTGSTAVPLPLIILPAPTSPKVQTGTITSASVTVLAGN